MNKNIAQFTIKTYEEKGKFYGKKINNNATGWNNVKRYYRFSTMERANDWAESEIANIKRHESDKAIRKLERQSFKNPAKVGDILDSNWGYDQTNIDFYKVTKVTPRTVTIRELSKEYLGNDGWGSDNVTASDSFKGKPMVKTVKQGWQKDPNDYYVSIASYAIASLWSGKDLKQTDAYHGH